MPRFGRIPIVSIICPPAAGVFSRYSIFLQTKHSQHFNLPYCISYIIILKKIDGLLKIKPFPAFVFIPLYIPITFFKKIGRVFSSKPCLDPAEHQHFNESSYIDNLQLSKKKSGPLIFLNIFIKLFQSSLLS